MTLDRRGTSEFGSGLVARALRGALGVVMLLALVVAYGNTTFFFYFTVLSNILATALMLGQAASPAWMTRNGSIRGAVTLYMTITGLVFAVLLAPIEADVGILDPWVNFVLHSLGPAAVLIDWLLFSPDWPLPRNIVWLWLVFPAMYLVVSLVRGPGADFYPYPFLDPRLPGGYGRVSLYVVAVALVFLVTGWFVKWWADKRRPPSFAPVT